MSMITPALVAQMADAMKMLTEMMAGYHKSLIDGGIPADSAARMAEEFHTRMMDNISPSKGKR